MNYKTPDGELVAGDSPTEILTKLKNKSGFCVDQPLDEYLSAISQRVKEYHGPNYIDLDYTQTLEYLIGVGYLTIMEL